MKLPSGAELDIKIAPFEKSTALYQSIAEEVRGVTFTASTEIDVNFKKDLFCTFLASKKIEAALWECLAHCRYNKAKITKETFEPVEARQDYLDVCYHVGEENIRPFVKSLYAEFSIILGALGSKSPA